MTDAQVLRGWQLGRRQAIAGVLGLLAGCAAGGGRIGVYLNRQWNVFECQRLGLPVFPFITLGNGEQALAVEMEKVGPAGRRAMSNWSEQQAGRSFFLDLHPVATGALFAPANLLYVADIDASSLKEASELARIDRWQDRRVHLRTRRPRSLAAGDLLVAADGMRYIVDIGGFEKLTDPLPARQRQG